MPIDALSVLCAQLTRDLFAIAKFLFAVAVNKKMYQCRPMSREVLKFIPSRS